MVFERSLCHCLSLKGQLSKTTISHVPLSRFYFDHQLEKCKFFEYSGCGGNFNNFMTMHECEAICLNLTSFNPETVSTVAKFSFNNGFPPLWNISHMDLEYSDPMHQNVTVGSSFLDMGLMESEFDLEVIFQDFIILSRPICKILKVFNVLLHCVLQNAGYFDLDFDVKVLGYNNTDETAANPYLFVQLTYINTTEHVCNSNIF